MKNLLKNYKDDMKIWKVFKTTKMIWKYEKFKDSKQNKF